MSLVGPRPLNREYLDSYTPEQARRHEVKPGITGLAQVRGRNALTWEHRFALDIEYVDRLSFGLDLRILVLTMVKVLRRENVTADGDLDVARFTNGSQLRAEARPLRCGTTCGELEPGGDA
jgi:hypothetical protein